MFPTDIRILIVDDMNTERKRVGFLLEEMGYKNVVEAADGNLAFEALEKEGGKVGLIMSDLIMPNCTGIEFLKKVRATEKYKRLPFIMFSTESEREVIIDAMIAGCSGYVIKPIQLEDLKGKMAKVFNRIASMSV